MIFTKFHENRLIIDGEVNEKHALLVECDPGQGIVNITLDITIINIKSRPTRPLLPINLLGKPLLALGLA